MISSGWRTWWRSIWIPGCCGSSAGFRLVLPAPSRASSLPHWNAVNCGSELARDEARRFTEDFKE
ncbi:hypothetical protein EI969_26175 [Pseudomonas sp. PB101]|nr:hypothetical protein [Pseudomonas sp. PB101]